MHNVHHGDKLRIVKNTLHTSLRAQCIDIYDLSCTQGDLIYMASGIVSGIGSFRTGKCSAPILLHSSNY